MSVPGIAPDYAQALAAPDPNAQMVKLDPNAPLPMGQSTIGKIGHAAQGIMGSLGNLALGGIPGLIAPDPSAAAAPVPAAAPPPVPAAAPLPAMPPAPPPVAAPARRGGGGGARPAVPSTGGPDDLEKAAIAAGKEGAEGVREVQTAKAEGADALARAQEGLATEQRAQAQELADKQQQTRQVQADLDRQDAENLKKARDYTIPDFWKGAEGARVGSILSIAAGGIASAITGGPNGALQIVNKNVDDYFHRQKEKIDNLYKYAEQTGRLNDKTRLRYAQELVDLKDQHAAINQSIATRLKAVEANNQGHVDSAAIQSMVAKIDQDTIKAREESRQTRAQIAHMQQSDAETARHNRAEEGIQRAAAAAKGAGSKADDSLIYDANGKPFVNAQTPQAAAKFREQQGALADLGKAIGELEQNYKKGATLPFGVTDTGRGRNAIMSRIVLAAKTVGGLGALSGPDMELVENLAGGKAGQLMGSPAGIANLRRLHETGVNTALSQVGAPPSAENRARFIAPGTPAGGQAAAPSQPAIGSRSTSGGKPIVFTANGWQYAP